MKAPTTEQMIKSFAAWAAEQQVDDVILSSEGGRPGVVRIRFHSGSGEPGRRHAHGQKPFSVAECSEADAGLDDMREFIANRMSD